MSSISELLKQKPAYVGYLTAGDGGMDRSFEMAMALISGGVDILEVGVPFSDPVADGPVIQAASQRALAHHTTLNDVLNLIKKIRQHSEVPIILFSYFNPIFHANRTHDFFKKAKAAGVDGCLMVDVCLEELDHYYQACIDADIDPILLIAPSTPSERIAELGKKGRGMLYYACRYGTTGVRSGLPDDFIDKMNDIKSLVDLPVVVGFGIGDAKMAKAVLEHADGFVVGSKFVKAIADGSSAAELTDLAQAIDPR